MFKAFILLVLGNKTTGMRLDPFLILYTVLDDIFTQYRITRLLRYSYLILIFLALSLIPLSNPVYAQTSTNLSLSKKEREWLDAHQVIRVGVDADYAPYSFVSVDGSYQGVAVDIFNKISGMLNVHFEFVPDLSWIQILEGAENRSLDVVATVVRTLEREKFLNFTDIYIPTPLVIMTRKDDFRINTVEDLEGKKIALVRGYSSSKKVIREHDSIEPYMVDTVLNGLRIVATGKADAYIGVLGVNIFQASKHGIVNLKVAGPYEMDLNGQRIGVREDWPELVSLLNRSINAIPESERISIINKWIPIEVEKKKYQLFTLTESEKRWLSEHKEIRLAIDPEFAPVEFIDERGNYSGISAEYVNVISKKLGIKMKVLPDISWSQSLELARKGEVDIFAAITPTQERKKYLNFTRPYFKYPIVLYTRNDFPIIAGLESLAKNTVAVVRDYYAHEIVKERYPELNLILVDSIHDGLSAVSLGNVDAFIGDTATATFEIRKHNLANLKIAAPTEFGSEGHAFAVRKDWPELIAIINKAMDTIPPEEHLAISKKWIEIKIDKFPIYWIWIAVTAGGLMLIFIVISTFLRIQVRRRTAELSLKNVQLENENAERQRAEKALTDSEQRLNKFFHATFEMVFFHEDGRIVDVNPATMSTTGYSPEDLIGKNLLDFVDEDSKQTVINKMMHTNEDPYEVNIITRSGEIVPVEVHATSITMKGHDVRVVSLRDITERKNNEEALKRAHDFLEIKVEERTAELVLANLRLKELDRLKSMFIASVSHELRTPLNSIIGFSSVMMNKVYGGLNDKYSDYITRINNSGQHLLSLITDIIDISKIESGHIDVEISEFELDKVVVEAVDNLRQQADNKNLYLEKIIPKDLILNTDRRRLLQCILNFISNAIKYSEQGTITVSAEDKGDMVVISVQDKGIGISEQDMHRLFGAFERFDSHMRVKAGGTGLGLYLTSKIATELLQGEVGAESVLDEGSKFWIKVTKILH